MYACLHGKGNLTALACEFSPTVEQTSADTVTLVAAAGFKYGFSTYPQFASRDCSPFEIPRFVMVDGIDEPELAHRLASSWHVAPRV